MSREEKKRAKEARRAAGADQHPAKQARTATGRPGAVKAARTLGIDHDDAFQRQPVWRFGDLDVTTGSPPTGNPLTALDYVELHKKLADFESSTCAEIWGASDRHGKYEVESAHQNIRKRLSAIDREDETAVHTLRLTGPFRVYGLLRQNIFYVLWIDRDHEMWPSPKKGT